MLVKSFIMIFLGKMRLAGSSLDRVNVAADCDVGQGVELEPSIVLKVIEQEMKSLHLLHKLQLPESLELVRYRTPAGFR